MAHAVASLDLALEPIIWRELIEAEAPANPLVKLLTSLQGAVAV